VRLEGCQAQAMRAMIGAKERELAALCEATVLPSPDLSALICDPRTESPGQARKAEGSEGDAECCPHAAML